MSKQDTASRLVHWKENAQPRRGNVPMALTLLSPSNSLCYIGPQGCTAPLKALTDLPSCDFPLTQVRQTEIFTKTLLNHE